MSTAAFNSLCSCRVCAHQRENFGELNEILNRLPQDELIVSLFKSAQQNGYITAQTRLDMPLVFVNGNEAPTLHCKKIDIKDLAVGPVRWECSLKGDLYLSVAIRQKGKLEPLNQGFFYQNVERPYFNGKVKTDTYFKNEPKFVLFGNLELVAKEIADDIDKLMRRENVFWESFATYTLWK